MRQNTFYSLLINIFNKKNVQHTKTKETSNHIQCDFNAEMVNNELFTHFEIIIMTRSFKK